MGNTPEILFSNPGITRSLVIVVGLTVRPVSFKTFFSFLRFPFKATFFASFLFAMHDALAFQALRKIYLPETPFSTWFRSLRTKRSV